MRKIFILIFALICIGLHAQERYFGITSGGNLVVSDGKMVTFYDDGYNKAAKTLFNKMSFDDMSSYQITLLKSSISQWYDTTEYYTIIDSLDTRYFFALQDTNDALLDWIRNTSATLTNTPLFTPWEGFTTNGSDSYIKSNYNPESGTNFKLNSNSTAYKINTDNVNVGAWPWGYRGFAAFHAMRILSGSVTSYYNNSITGHDGTGADNFPVNLYGIVTRWDSDTTRLSLYGTAYKKDLSAVISVPDQSLGIFIGALNNRGIASNFDTNQYAIFNSGASLSQTQAQKLYEADTRLLNTFYDPLYIIAGQSNAAGRGYSDSLSSPYDVRIDNVGFILNDTDGNDEFGNLVAGSGTSDWPNRFGLEISLGYNLGQERDTVYIAKCGHGSASIADFSRGGTYNSELINTIDNALVKSGKSTIEFIWYQGEQDWFDQSTTYLADLNTFFTQLNADIDGVIIRTIIVEVKYDLFPLFTDVHDAQISYVNSNNYTYYEDTDGFTYTDHVHLNTQGYLDIGLSIFNKEYTNTK